MMRLAILLLLFLAPGAHAVCKQAILDRSERRLMGGEENLCAAHGGKVILVVNTASKCGFTPQFAGLEALYRSRREQGLVVLGFPSDQFMDQEFQDEKQIAEFCKVNYGVSFPMYRKTDVKGEAASPFFKELTAATGEAPAWNFNKYLIGRDGKVVGHYASQVKPDSGELARAIEAALRQRAP